MLTAVPQGEVSRGELQAAEKVATWKVFKCCMKVIFMADQVPPERQYALILLVEVTKHSTTGTLFKYQVSDPKDPEQVWKCLRRASSNQLHFGISEMFI